MLQLLKLGHGGTYGVTERGSAGSTKNDVRGRGTQKQKDFEVEKVDLVWRC